MPSLENYLISELIITVTFYVEDVRVLIPVKSNNSS